MEGLRTPRLGVLMYLMGLMLRIKQISNFFKKYSKYEISKHVKILLKIDSF